MACTHQVKRDDHGTSDVLENAAVGIRVRIARTGAEMVSLARRAADGSWTGFLYRDGDTGPPADGWGNHATVMGYYIHRLVGGSSTYRGETITGGNHGFLRAFEFAEPTFDADRGALTYRVAAANVPPSAYPLRVALALTYRLDGSALRGEFEFTNEESTKEAHLSFGLHPGFAVTSVRAADILLPAGTYVRHWAPDNFLDGRTERIPFVGGPMPFAKDDLPSSFLLGIEEVPAARFTVRDELAGREVVCDYTGCPYVTIWSDLGPFVCIEPCWGLPDSRPQRPFADKIGIQRVAPGGTLRAGFSIEPHLLT
jgi:galactose mutarotase-like enzyme